MRANLGFWKRLFGSFCVVKKNPTGQRGRHEKVNSTCHQLPANSWGYCNSFVTSRIMWDMQSRLLCLFLVNTELHWASCFQVSMKLHLPCGLAGTFAILGRGSRRCAPGSWPHWPHAEGQKYHRCRVCIWLRWVKVLGGCPADEPAICRSLPQVTHCIGSLFLSLPRVKFRVPGFG